MSCAQLTAAAVHRNFGLRRPTRASPQAKPTVWLAESLEKRRNRPQRLEKEAYRGNLP